jgi:hypothetical protein
MTSRDFQLIADVIASLPTDRIEGWDTDLIDFEAIVKAFSARLAQDNERFDSDRFEEACRR